MVFSQPKLMNLHFKTKLIRTAAHGADTVAIKRISFYLSMHIEKKFSTLNRF